MNFLKATLCVFCLNFLVVGIAQAGPLPPIVKERHAEPPLPPIKEPHAKGPLPPIKEHHAKGPLPPIKEHHAKGPLPPIVKERHIDPPVGINPEECGKDGVVCFHNENQELVGTTESTLLSALDLLSSSGLKFTPEGVVISVGAIATGVLILKYGRSLNPIGAFFLVLGVSPVAAADYCSMYEGETGLDYFLNELSRDEQMLEFSMCPELAEEILDISIQIQEATIN